MSIDKDQDEQKNDVGVEDSKKEGGGLFGRLFGRRKKTEDEVVAVHEPDLEDGVSELAGAKPVVELKKEENQEPDLPVSKPSGAEIAETDLPLLSVEVESVEDQIPATTDLSESDLAKNLDDVVAPEKKEKRGLFSRLRQGLAKTRNQFVGTLDNLFYGDKEIDEEFLEELEEILLTSDLGVKTSYRLFSQIEDKVSHQELENPAHLRDFLQSQIGAILSKAESSWEMTEKPYVIMTIGVNGVGKTTTIGKLASIFTKRKKKVVLGAADTFRAAAVEQLMIWAERAKVPIIKQSMGADPAAVAFDTVQSAIKREADIVIIDTAGRLHNKVNLMDEL
ncbi:MAG: signal recognition particle-docking protein FtsY, partial [Deltaproteobacteria bacterium]